MGLIEGLLEQLGVVRAYLQDEMGQRGAPVRGGRQRVTHQRRRVPGPGAVQRWR